MTSRSRTPGRLDARESLPSVAERLRGARRRAGFSQELLARKAGVARGTIQLIERGKTLSPHPETLFVLAKTLGMNPRELEALPASSTVASPLARQTCPGWEEAVGRLIPAPALLAGREADLDLLRRRLLGSEANSPAAGSRQSTVALHGWPGVGKTALAAALARDSGIARHFTGGILCCSLGPTPDLWSELASCCRAAGIDSAKLAGEGVESLSRRLAFALRDRRTLVVVDDVWRLRDATPFRVGGSGSAMLLTTRSAGLADDIAIPAHVYRVRELDEPAARTLLRELTPDLGGHFLDALTASARSRLLRWLDGLPLALHVAASLLKAGARLGDPPDLSIARLLAEPRRIYAASLPFDIATPEVRTVHDRLVRSLEQLSAEERSCFAALARASRACSDARSPSNGALRELTPGPCIARLVDLGFIHISNGRKRVTNEFLRTYTALYGDGEDPE